MEINLHKLCRFQCQQFNALFTSLTRIEDKDIAASNLLKLFKAEAEVFLQCILLLLPFSISFKSPLIMKAPSTNLERVATNE